MRLRLTHVLTMLPAALLAACAATPPHAYLPDAARDKIASTEVVMPIRQNEIYVYVPPSQAGAQAGASMGFIGALVGAMVDAGVNDARTSKAEAAVKPLRDSMVDYNFDTTIQGDVRNSLGQVGMVHVGNVHVVKEVTNDAMDGVLAGSKSDAVLFTTADYHLSNNGEELDVELRALMYPNSDTLRTIAPGEKTKFKTDAKNTFYRNTFAFQATLPNATGNRDSNIASWSASNGAAMRQALNMSSQKLAQMLAADIQSTQAAESAKTGETAKVDGADVTVVATDADGRTVRFKDGHLKYVKN